MKISQSWLDDFVDCADLSRDAFYELITTKVAEVDGVHIIGAPLSDAKVAKILSVQSHPTKPQLQIARLSLGDGEVEVVCGASNCRADILTAYVAPGGLIKSPDQEGLLKVGEREVAGVLSKGILASESELDLTNDHRGIIELSDRSRPGDSLHAVYGQIDTVIEIDNKSLTHRPDLWSHLGFARELSAILGRSLKRSPDRWADSEKSGEELWKALGSGPANFETAIAPDSKCRRFMGLEFSNVTISESPIAIRRKLYAVGAGVRNFLVDLSNYVMLDIGQPNHAYDASLLSGRVLSARMAKKDERFVGLDGVERRLTVEDVVIADEKKAIALAGVIGGQECSINDRTTRLFLESANFDPVVLRLSTKRQALRTDASNRFEKSRSPFAVPLAVQRFAELLLQTQPQAKIVGPVVDCFLDRPKSVSVPFRYEYIRERLDPAIDTKTVERILSSLGFGLKETSPSQWEASVPYERATRDISIENDLVEEVGRIFGYERITELPPLIQSIARAGNEVLELENRLRDRLCGLGFSESYQYSFMSREKAERLGYETTNAVRLLNPIDSNNDVIRTSLIPGALDQLEKNARFFEEIFFFEVGRAYEMLPSKSSIVQLKKGDNAASERRLLSLCYRSQLAEERAGQVTSPPQKTGASFFSLVSVVTSILRSVTSKAVTLVPLEGSAAQTAAGNFSELKAWMHPYRAASVVCEGKAVGVIAETNPLIGMELPERSVLAELDLGTLLGIKQAVDPFQQLSKFPDSFFEMSIVMPERAYYSELEQLLRKSSDAQLLRRIDVLEVYAGAPLKEGEKSVSVCLSFGADDRTLSGEEISRLQGSLMKSIRDSQFTLRG